MGRGQVQSMFNHFMFSDATYKKKLMHSEQPVFLTSKISGHFLTTTVTLNANDYCLIFLLLYAAQFFKRSI